MTNTSERVENLPPLKRALLELRELRAKLDQAEQARSEPVAIVGIGQRFPGDADSPESLWQLLRDGVDAIGPIPPDRWDAEALYDPDPEAPGKMYTRHGAFLSRIDQFDPAFFGISPREAASMDPQQRLLLETAWQALERAGQAPDTLNGSQTGVFIGIANSDHFHMLARDTEAIDVYVATGNTFSVAAGRISYVLGLHGPALSVDTACSSSLAVVHLAVQSLRARECDMALAGGVNLILSPEANITFSKAQMMARDGRCKTFDAAADGYVRGEGCGMVVLKRLSDAQAAGDEVLAVICGTAVNQDGRSSGLTAPNGPAQEAVIGAALANGGIAPHEVGYVEAHGTGTALGDPIEVQALGAALGAGRNPDQPLLVGSLKTNMGHLEAAAGIAGLIKAVLALRHGQIPANVHFQTPNPHIPWDRLPIRVPTELTPWPAGYARRIAGVSSFGFSGTNAHVVLAEAPADQRATNDTRPLHLLALSAKTEAALRELVDHYTHLLAEQPALPLPDICHTANTGRATLERRAAVLATTTAQLHERLAAFGAGREAPGVLVGTVAADAPQVAFLFTGHGATYRGMARQLYAAEPVFRAALDRCAALLLGQIDQPLATVLGYGDAPDAGNDLLDSMAYAQPALLAVQYALGELWRSWGVVPALVAGHSAGEYAAACFAGVFSLEDAMRLVVARGRLMQSLPRDGEMVAVFTDEASVAAAVAPFSTTVSIAAVNGPHSVVVSGRREDVAQVVARFRDAGVQTRRLDIAVAAHSPRIDGILDQFARVAATVRYHPPQVGLVSTLTGALANAETLCNPDYWRRHLRQPVRFADAMQELANQGCTAFVEIGPHPTLLGMARRAVPEAFGLWLPSLREGTDDNEQMYESLASLFVHGALVDWRGFDAPFSHRTAALPTYPFQRQRYWSASAHHQRPATGALARWHATTSAARNQSEQGPLDLDIARYPERWARLNEFATASIACAFRELGQFTRTGERHSAEEIADACGISASYRRLLRRWLNLLAEDGMLVRDGEVFVAPAPLPDTTRAARERAAVALAGVQPLLQYALRCGERLSAVITGAENALDTLFPGGSYETVDYIYHQWAVARYFNNVIRTVAGAIAAAQPGRPLRVLEIGAGTGGTAATLLPAMPADSTVYHFTDVSDFFLARARERFAAYPFVRYTLLDIERSPVEQGFAAHGYDLVVAANVLHATRDLDQTLQHARSLLAPGGVLAAYEATSHPHWMDITTGLIEGWQLFEDTWRSDNPLLAPERWAEALHANGFEAVISLPEPNAATAVLGQHVLLARAPLALDPQRHAAPSLPAHEQPAPTPAAPDAPNLLLHELAEALPADRYELLVAVVREHTARVLRLDPSTPPDRDARLMDMGVDSLMAVELRNRLNTGLGLPQKLPATLIFDYPSIAAIARLLERLVSEEHATSSEPLSTPRSRHTTVETAVLAAMSDEEVEALLLNKLENL